MANGRQNLAKKTRNARIVVRNTRIGKRKKVGFTCKCKLCLRCFKTAVDGWLNQARKVLFEGVVHPPSPEATARHVGRWC